MKQKTLFFMVPPALVFLYFPGTLVRTPTPNIVEIFYAGGHSGAVRLGIREQQAFRRVIRLQRMTSMSMTWVYDDPPGASRI